MGNVDALRIINADNANLVRLRWLRRRFAYAQLECIRAPVNSQDYLTANPEQELD